MTDEQSTVSAPVEHVALARIGQARRLLMEAKTLPEITAVRDMAEAARLYARAAKLGLQAMNAAAEIKVRAERKAGEIQKRADKNTGMRGSFRGRSPSGDTLAVSPEDPTPTVAESGITLKQSSQWQALADIPEQRFEQAISDAKDDDVPITTAEMVRVAKEERQKAHAETIEQLISATGGPSPESELRRLRLAFVRASRGAEDAFALNTDALADAFTGDDQVLLRSFLEAARSWCDRMGRSLARPPRLTIAQ